MTKYFATGKVGDMDKHPLAAWMETRPEISQAQLASDAECSGAHLSLVLQRKRGVSMKLARRLSNATGGAVKVEDFVLDREVAQ